MCACFNKRAVLVSELVQVIYLYLVRQTIGCAVTHYTVLVQVEEKKMKEKLFLSCACFNNFTMVIEVHVIHRAMTFTWVVAIFVKCEIRLVVQPYSSNLETKI